MKIEICDLIREAILIEESEHFLVFDELDRKELLFLLFKLLLLGGGVN